jgi:hypothetical protein
MKHIKKFNFINETFINELSDDELEEKLEYLNIELKDLQDEILSISYLLKNRKEEKDIITYNNLPESIFDLNQDQLLFVLEYHPGIGQKRHDMAKKYLNQLDGVYNNGFNQNTNQYHFSIRVSSLYNEDESEYQLNDNSVNSIKFLGNNLKKNNGYVDFNISYYYSPMLRSDKLLYSEDEILYVNGRSSIDKMKSIEYALEIMVKNDLSEKDEDS